MTVRSLLSLGLVILPIGATLGLLIGLDAQRRATGQVPLFVDNSISHKSYCQKSYGVSPPSYGQTYTLNPNQWAWQPGDPGSLCMKVTQWNNMTYPTKTTAPKFSVTWDYPPGPTTQPVHAFPNIALNKQGTVFPVRVGDISHLYVNIEWSYGLGTKPGSITDVGALEDAAVNANVAIDMFLDSDETKAQSTTDAKYEVMVWLARIGAATQPIGWGSPVVKTTLNNTNFELFHGKNALHQYVLTWYAETPTPEFVGDLTGLLTLIPTLGIKNAPSTKDYLGYMGLGSETLSAPQKVTFAVPHLSMEVM